MAENSSTAKAVRQDAVVDLLVAGSTVTAAAQAMGIDRRTIERWMKEPDFVASLNGRRRTVWGAMHDRVRTLINRALDIVEEHLESGDYGAARDVIRIWGGTLAASLADIGPDQVAELERERQASGDILELRDRVLGAPGPSGVPGTSEAS